MRGLQFAANLIETARLVLSRISSANNVQVFNQEILCLAISLGTNKLSLAKLNGSWNSFAHKSTIPLKNWRR